MKKRILWAIGLLLSYLFVKAITRRRELEYVYSCGESSVFHADKSHAALANCNSEIIQMEKSDAIVKGLRECKCKN